jgi:hypothetical protein
MVPSSLQRGAKSSSNQTRQENLNLTLWRSRKESTWQRSKSIPAQVNLRGKHKP